MNYSFRGRSSRSRPARRLLFALLLLVAAGTSLGWIMSRREAEQLEKRLLAAQQQLAALKADRRVEEVAAYQLPAAPQDLLAWQAYVLMHQAEALWRGAYESWLAGDWWRLATGDGQRGTSRTTTDSNEEGLSQQGQLPAREELHSVLLATLRQELAAVASAPYLNELVNRLQQVIAGGEGEVSFPSRDELRSLKVVQIEEADEEETGEEGAAARRTRAVVEVQARRHVPAYEWSGRAYFRDVTWQIELVSTPLGWRISRVSEQSGAPRPEA
ncbi:MAG: hypothetical protein IMX00_09595 [Limnochordales bacterium]|nr:hypothetical protein [Limnochordales bacterium]